MVVLITGAAGFIGYHLSIRLLKQGHAVVGFDNVNPYYDPALKRARIAQLEAIAKRFELLLGEVFTYFLKDTKNNKI